MIAVLVTLVFHCQPDRFAAGDDITRRIKR